MKPLILVVEDNPTILTNIKMILDFNQFKVLTAKDGIDAIEVLNEVDPPPDLILSDILMPRMNGYDFFRTVSNNPRLFHIPFIFVSARSTPEDVRFGKMLGVDDYVTKPFKEEDLLAIITGKLARNKKIKLINQKILEIISELYTPASPAPKLEVFLVVDFKKNAPPTMRRAFPEGVSRYYNLQELSNNLIKAISAIYQKEELPKAEGLLLTMQSINKDSYIYFDSYYDKTENTE